MSSTETAGDDRTRPRPAAWGLLAALGLAGWIVALAYEPPRAWQALLVNFNFFTPLAAGLVTFSAAVVLTNGRWMGELERLAVAGVAFAVPSLLALGGLWAGSSQWAPWLKERPLVWPAWVDNTPLFVRDFCALAIFWLVAALYVRRRLLGRPTRTAAVVVFVYIVVFTLLGVDLVMTLNVTWFSALWGGYFLITGVYVALVLLAIKAALSGSAPSNRLRDLGKLVVTFSLLAAYFMFCQLITIWYENLPHETSYLAPRMNSPPWKWVSYALLASIYLGPLVLLLPRRAKTTRWWLAAVCLLLGAGLWVERWWEVQPAFQAEMKFSLAQASALALMLGLAGLTMSLCHRRLPKEPFKELAPQHQKGS